MFFVLLINFARRGCNYICVHPASYGRPRHCMAVPAQNLGASSPNHPNKCTRADTTKHISRLTFSLRWLPRRCGIVVSHFLAALATFACGRTYRKNTKPIFYLLRVCGPKADLLCCYRTVNPLLGSWVGPCLDHGRHTDRS